MTKIEMIEEFVCPGCVNGSDTKCGTYKPQDRGSIACKAHVLGTFVWSVGNVALGLPKGFNRAGWEVYPESDFDNRNTMCILCWTKEEAHGIPFDNFNVPVWALEKDGFLFVRTYRPRLNGTSVEVIEGGTLDLVPGAIDVSDFYDDMD